MDNILNEFNARIALNDYTGAANYLKGFKFQDKTIQDNVEQQIAKLERYGGITNAILSKEIDLDKKNLIAFGLNRYADNFGGKDEQTGEYLNPYAKTFIQHLDNIGNKDNKQADYLDIEFDSQESYNKFKEHSGLSFSNKNEDNQLSPYLYNNNGNPVIRIHKPTLQNGTFFNNFTKGLINTSENFHNPGYFMAQGQTVNVPHYTIKSYDVENKLLNYWSGLGNDLQQAYNITRAATDVYENTMKIAYSKVTPTELMSSGFMCDAERQITKAMDSGQIDETRGKGMLKRIKDYYNNLLNTVSLTGYDVYATDPSGMTANLLEVEDTETKQQYTQWIRTAIKEGRLTATAGVEGGRVGTILTISATVDKDGQLGEDAHGGIQLFVPGLLDDDARQLIDQDVDAKILVERAEHIAFGHEYNLFEGGRLINFNGDGSATYKDDLGEVYKSPEEVSQLMLQNEMLNGTVKELKKQLNTEQYSDEEFSDLITQYATKVYDYVYEKTPTQNPDETEPSIKHDEIDVARIENIVQLMIVELKRL